MIPARFAQPLFALILSGMMSFMVSGISTAFAAPTFDGFFGAWMGAWAPSWIFAFPGVLLVAPVARRIVAKLIAPG
jgi:hypothetical protein